MKIYFNISIRKTALFFLLLWGIATAANTKHTMYQQAVRSDELLKNAENAYYEEDFPAAVKFSNRYLEQVNLTNEDKEKAYILLTHIYLAVDDTVDAEKSVNNILGFNLRYSPTLEMETPKYVNFVTKIKEKYASKSRVVTPKSTVKKSLNINWYIVGGAGVAVTVIAILLLSGDDDKTADQPLSMPPQLPQ